MEGGGEEWSGCEVSAVKRTNQKPPGRSGCVFACVSFAYKGTMHKTERSERGGFSRVIELLWCFILMVF